MKKLKDIILKKLTDASMSGCRSLNVFKKGSVIDNPADNAIAIIPVIPQVTGSYIAGMYKDEYAKLVPYENCNVVDEKIFHSVESGIHNYTSIIIIDSESMDKNVISHEDSSSGNLIHDKNTSFYIDTPPLHSRLQQTINDCSKIPNYCGVYVRSINTMRLLGQFAMLTPDMPNSEVQKERIQVDSFLSMYGNTKIICERVMERAAGTSPDLFFEIFIDDFDHDYAKEYPVGNRLNNRYNIMSFLIHHLGKEVSFNNCAQMSITMQDEQNHIVDYVNLKF